MRRAIREGNASHQRTFTLPQFVKCLENVSRIDASGSADRAREIVAAAHKQRSEGDRRVRESEVVDPLGGPTGAYRNTALLVQDLCERLVAGLFG